MVDNRYWTKTVTTPLIRESIKKNHQETHVGADAIIANIRRYAIGPRMQKLANIVVRQCSICCKNNTKIQKRPPLGQVKRGQTPGKYWQIDFSELPRCNQFKYLLVLVDSFSGRSEALPCQTNKAREVVRVPLKEFLDSLSLKEWPQIMGPALLLKLCRKLLSSCSVIGFYVLLGGHNPVGK